MPLLGLPVGLHSSRRPRELLAPAPASSHGKHEHSGSVLLRRRPRELPAPGFSVLGRGQPRLPTPASATEVSLGHAGYVPRTCMLKDMKEYDSRHEHSLLPVASPAPGSPLELLIPPRIPASAPACDLLGFGSCPRSPWPQQPSSRLCSNCPNVPRVCLHHDTTLGGPWFPPTPNSSQRTDPCWESPASH